MQAQKKIDQKRALEIIYDAIMFEIEPELMTANIDDVDSLYQDETPEEHSERYEQYSKAFEEAEKRLGKVLSCWRNDLLSKQKQKIKQLQKQSDDHEKDWLSSLEQSFS